MARFLSVCMAGALGTGVRYLVALGAAKALFPYGTLIVNLAGCFLIAGVTQVALSTSLVSPTLRLVLTTGFLGGLTTYSAFNYETTHLLQQGAWRAALLNYAATTLGCFAAGLLGLALARRLVSG